MTDTHTLYWRAKRLFNLAARAHTQATRRLCEGLPARQSLERANRLQRIAKREWKRCAI